MAENVSYRRACQANAVGILGHIVYIVRCRFALIVSAILQNAPRSIDWPSGQGLFPLFLRTCDPANRMRGTAFQWKVHHFEQFDRCLVQSW